MTRVGIITQARMTSTRLPGKVLLPAGGRSLLDHHIDRLQRLGLPLIVATTTNAADDPIAALALTRGTGVFRGSESDVLSRFAGAAREARLDTVVRVTSDCPLIDPAVIEEGIRRYIELDDPSAHVSNVLERTYPRGFDFEVFSAAALREADERSSDPVDREHVTPYLYRNRSGHAALHAVTRSPDASRYRLTVDTPEDLVVVRALIEQHGAAALDASGIIDLLEEHPELVAINAHVEQKKLGA
ncbi:acylneuraminate cytidylyltransferase [Microbacterium sp. MYb54]|nr:acylneuraminate cytidylyltransferase [Microbacterium sp. MYb43]PQZ79337.1 acylneuraminate cytidylyltransferase [Microbacterium sp. MYb40]PRB19905.1 acylneuraminate cytidylyltransferase [Microbacterium sp. MYb54]PRB26895.1 acylneuraminate cytidylyltransferase [Microbacterium sp. MYb50]PRB66021.1 acylneuraminate cytidylyltransferase [Microbacterium sp. MYb24]PRB73251.1 acylneuraminate cytidylyltransferase [Microbacterium sp. MYb32]